MSAAPSILLAQNGTALIRCTDWLGVLWGLSYVWITCIGVILISVGSPLQRRYLTLKTALLLIELRKLPLQAMILIEFAPRRLGFALQVVAVSGQLAIARLHLRYLLLKQIIIHKFQGREKTPNYLITRKAFLLC